MIPEAVRAVHLEIVPRNNEHPERFIRRFVKKVRADGILQEVFLRKSYMKPSQKKKFKSARARSRRAHPTD